MKKTNDISGKTRRFSRIIERYLYPCHSPSHGFQTVFHMRITELLKKGKPISLEISPPRNGEPVKELYEVLTRLTRTRKLPKVDYDSKLLPMRQPEFISVTYSSLGSARGGIVQLAANIGNKYNVDTIAHMTCGKKSRQQIENQLMEMRYAGLENIIVVRGDKPKGARNFQANNEGHKYAYQMVQQIAEANRGNFLNGKGTATEFCIGVAAYPDKHPQCRSMKRSIEELKLKFDSGADFAVTQLFFDSERYLKLLDDAAYNGIKNPIIPGILSLESWKQMKFLEEKLGVSVPDTLKEKVERYRDDSRAVGEIGIEHAVRTCEAIIKSAPGLHFYTLNKISPIDRVLDGLSVR